MTTDTLPKDPEAAASLLASLVEKDKDTGICRYPTCPLPRQETSGESGRPSAYCQNLSHSSVTNFRARQQLKATAARTTQRREEPSQSKTVAATESLRGSILSRLTFLQTDLERYVTALTELSDPDISAAQMQANLDDAKALVAEAQQVASAERSRRLIAEAELIKAEGMTRSASEAAEQAIENMEETETKFQNLIKESQQQLTELQTELEAKIDKIRQDANLQIEAAKEQALQTSTSAQEEAKQAKKQEADARIQATTATQLLSDAQIALERERKEVDRLHTSYTSLMADLQERHKADRKEDRTALEQERKEVQQLRTELANLRQQNIQLNELYNKLLQTQLAQQEPPKLSH